MTETIRIEKLVHGGQGIGTLANGQRVFVWNALPGETVEVELKKKRSKLAEGVAVNALKPSEDRVAPKDTAYLSTSPWQMMTFSAENQHKQAILTETLQREHVQYEADIPMVHGQKEWHYRNKMEYSFWADDDGLHLALFNRGTHQKQIVDGSSIAMPEVDEAARKVVAVLNQHQIRGSQLKTVVVRANQQGGTVVALFVKDETFPRLDDLSSVAQGVVVNYSTPKSPASVLTRELYRFGDISLEDTVGSWAIRYDVHSFFQVNLEIFNMALNVIKENISPDESTVDMYAGVGTIGIPVGATKIVEIDPHNIEMARQNVADAATQIVQASAEASLEHITSDSTLIVDPPRAGLHPKVIERIQETKPSRVIYLSCNPITQARDLALLQDTYKILAITGYNFFPRTPHIESLAILERI